VNHSAPKTFLYYQTAEKIKAMILNDGLAVGSYLPSERKLAEMFGVAFLTVRKALELLVSEDIIQKIPSKGSVIIKLPAASRSSGLRRKRIGVTIWGEAGINHPAIQSLLSLSGQLLPASEYEIVVLFINNEMIVNDNWDVLLNPDNLDGMFITVQEIPEKIIKQLQKLEIPKVFLNFPGMTPGGWTDYLAGINNLINYFVSLGHRNIAFINGNIIAASVTRKIESFRICCENHGLPLYENSIIAGDFSERSGYENTLKLLRDSTDWDAILLGDDYMAMGALNAIKLMGLSCPQDISIACFEGCNFAEQLSPPVTVLSSRDWNISPCVKCLEMLKDMIENNAKLENKSFTYKPELIIRESTAVKRPTLS
jgi:DNA-binding LacI/PurR family transcriptional regulator